jgi:hypothetical protein
MTTLTSSNGQFTINISSRFDFVAEILSMDAEELRKASHDYRLERSENTLLANLLLSPGEGTTKEEFALLEMAEEASRKQLDKLEGFLNKVMEDLICMIEVQPEITVDALPFVKPHRKNQYFSWGWDSSTTRRNCARDLVFG